MSITFDIPCDCKRVTISCPLCGGENFRDLKHDACFMGHDEGSGMYLDCAAQERCEHEDLGVNMANGNARAVIEALGIDFDYCGQIAVEDVLGRAGLRAALPADEPVPTVRRGNMIHCGRDEGYISGKAQMIGDLAVRAREDGYSYIQWG